MDLLVTENQARGQAHRRNQATFLWAGQESLSPSPDLEARSYPLTALQRLVSLFTWLPGELPIQVHQPLDLFLPPAFLVLAPRNRPVDSGCRPCDQEESRYPVRVGHVPGPQPDSFTAGQQTASMTTPERWPCPSRRPSWPKLSCLQSSHIATVSPGGSQGPIGPSVGVECHASGDSCPIHPNRACWAAFQSNLPARHRQGRSAVGEAGQGTRLLGGDQGDRTHTRGRSQARQAHLRLTSSRKPDPAQPIGSNALRAVAPCRQPA
jgi:hypothetical protein